MLEVKTVKIAGGYRVLYGGKDCWFLHRDEAQYSLDGHTGPEALDLILGQGAVYRLSPKPHLINVNKPLMNKEVSRWIAETCSTEVRV